MREIKYRGKSIETGEWIYGYYVCTHDRHRIIYEDYEGCYCEEEVDPETVGQYTGLKDRNGTEIYEGDILLVTSEIYTNFGKIPTGKFSKEYYEVIWKDDGWGYKVLRSDHTIEGTEIKGLKVTTKYAKVIGNIFQDGDLLDSEISKVDRDCKRG
jgi:uncharacterized phage protein (TIGR01671 family)